jgi:hypothetical protein
VRVVRAEPRAGGRVRLDVVTLDEQSRLISRNFNREELERLVVETEPGELALDGDPAGFKLAAEATRMRVAYTYDPQFAVSVARIDPLPHQLEAVYHTMLKQPRLIPFWLPSRSPWLMPLEAVFGAVKHRVLGDRTFSL